MVTTLGQALSILFAHDSQHDLVDVELDRSSGIKSPRSRRFRVVFGTEEMVLWRLGSQSAWALLEKLSSKPPRVYWMPVSVSQAAMASLLSCLK